VAEGRVRSLDLRWLVVKLLPSFEWLSTQPHRCAWGYGSLQGPLTFGLKFGVGRWFFFLDAMAFGIGYSLQVGD
jgi:hypothetical protein